MAFKLVPQETHINFLGARFVCIALSLFFLLATIGLLLVKGLNYGIDFSGGTLIQMKIENPVPVAKIRYLASKNGYENLIIQEYGAKTEILVRAPIVAANGNATQYAQHLADLISAEAGTVEVRRVEFVGPQIGEELKQKGLFAVLLSALAILVYVSVRFEFRFAIGAVGALIHDVMLTIGVFSLLQKEISMPVLAAFLTILGYSLNDTIVVFDRVRENIRRFKKKPLVTVLNISINEMLNRTLMMTLTTAIVLVALFLYGGEVIHDFAFALLVGVVVGTYSSIYIASPIVLWMRREEKPIKDENNQ